jgi:hypothetical protein
LEKAKSVHDLDRLIFKFLKKHDFSKEKIIDKIKERELRIVRAKYSIKIAIICVCFCATILYAYVFFKPLRNIQIIYMNYLIILTLSIAINYLLIDKIIMNFFKVLSKELPRLL